jgi:tellurite resistance protein
MTDEEKTMYLANVYYLLIADGGLDRPEERALDEIRRDLRAGYFEMMKAKEMAQKEGFLVQLVGRWSDRVANFEDMLFAAYCNGVFEHTEKKALQQYAKQLGIDQAQFDVIKQETKRRYADFKAKST